MLSFDHGSDFIAGVIYILDHKNKTTDKIVIGEAVSEGEITDKEVNELLSSTTLVKTSPVMGMLQLICKCDDSFTT